MPRINVLPKNIADLIAAGEVVERPSSVIKEFVENSIDAGAKNITIEIQNGGKTYLRVADNGCGIHKDDVRKAFISHATSKITKIDDLDAISTLGFRGEALASVCAVSRVELLTRSEDSDTGTRYVIEGGEEQLIDDAGCPVGTTLIVRDLFYNIPARMKFLKKDTQEGNYIAGLVERIAISNPGISFRFIREGKLQFSTPGDGDLKSAVYSVFGREFTEQLLTVSNEQNGISVKGFITKPTAGRGSRSMQIFFVNKRYVKNVVFLSALEAAYKNSIMVGKFPGCVLFVDLPFEAVDVNVHPAKTEVRFYDEKRIFDCIYNGVLSALTDDKSRVKATFSEAKIFAKPADKGEQLTLKDTEAKTTFVVKEFGKPITGTENIVHSPHNNEPKQLDFLSNEGYLKAETKTVTVDISAHKNENPEIIVKSPVLIKSEVNTSVSTYTEVTHNEDNLNETNEINKLPDTKEEESVLFEEKVIPDFQYVGEAFGTYLIAEIENKLMLIDKHAAHERILFERFKKEGIGESQIMLRPITVTLSSDEYAAVIDNLSLLYDSGYDVSDFGDRCVKVSACPPVLSDSDISEVITEIAGYLSLNIKTILPEKLDWIYHSMACRAAVKAKNFTSSYEAELFIKELLRRDDIRYCPHGRPVLIEISKRDLEKQFRRIV